MMIADVLVGLEDSPEGRRALAVAQDIARSLGATLVGMPTDGGGTDFAPDLTVLRLEGPPGEAVRRELLRHDITVLGREAAIRFGPRADDSDDGTVPPFEKPILVVPDSGKPSVPGSAVLIAYDGSAAAKRALKSFGESGLGRGRPIHVATVGDDAGAAWETAVDGCELLLELGVTAAAANLTAAATVSRALLEERARLGAGLLVLGAYTRSHQARLLWGSVTQEMLDRTEVPLFLHY